MKLWWPQCEAMIALKLAYNLFNGSREFKSEKESFQSILVLYGNAELVYNGAKYILGKGDSWFIPANSGKYTVSGDIEFLISTL